MTHFTTRDVDPNAVIVPKGPDGCGCTSYGSLEHVEHVAAKYRDDWEKLRGAK